MISNMLQVTKNIIGDKVLKNIGDKPLYIKNGTKSEAKYTTLYHGKEIIVKKGQRSAATMCG